MRLEYLKDYEVTEAISQQAIRLRNSVCRWENLGATYPFTLGEQHYVGRVERHYHPPGGPIRPWGPHPGISVLRVLDEPSTARPHQSFVLGARSRSRLIGVHSDLVAVVNHAIGHTPIDFTVVEGVRTLERQRELVNKGASQTLKSRHPTGHAVDLAPWIGGTISWEWEHFNILGPTVLQAAEELGIKVEWGGNWEGFRDGPHFQLPWKEYPA